MKARTLLAGCLALAAVAAGSSPVAAAQRPGTWEKELYFGTYDPNPELFDPVGTVGMRVHYVATSQFSVSGELGFINRTDIEFEIAGPETTGVLEYDALFVDASLRWSPLRGERWALSAFAGPGWSFVSGRVGASNGGRPEVVISGLEDDSFNAFGGASVKWYFGQGFYLRLAGRYRWFEAREGEDLDRELTLALGL